MTTVGAVMADGTTTGRVAGDEGAAVMTRGPSISKSGVTSLASWGRSEVEKRPKSWTPESNLCGG